MVLPHVSIKYCILKFLKKELQWWEAIVLWKGALIRVQKGIWIMQLCKSSSYIWTDLNFSKIYTVRYILYGGVNNGPRDMVPLTSQDQKGSLDGRLHHLRLQDSMSGTVHSLFDQWITKRQILVPSKYHKVCHEFVMSFCLCVGSKNGSPERTSSILSRKFW